jgi:hypothetical protein
MSSHTKTGWHFEYDVRVDMSRTQISNSGGEVVFTDPEWPFRISVQIDTDSDVPFIRQLSVEATDDRRITSSTLSQIPVLQLARVVAGIDDRGGETLYRMLAVPKQKGFRGWPPDHFSRVSRVARWARSTGRPGGAVGTVAEFWDVHLRTARRWLDHPWAEVRR